MSAPGPRDLIGTTRAVLADFGLAKSVATGSKLTHTGEALGTPAYMSPEQARGEVSSLTAATDVWSLGCVLYEMIARGRPFEGESDAAVVGQVLLAEPPGLRARAPDVPRPVARVATICLAKRARERYPDGAALRDDLDRLLRGEPPRRRPPGAARRRIAGAALACGLVLGAAALIWPGARAGAPGPGAPRPSEAEALAIRAGAARATDPRGAAGLLGEALRRAPDRHDWRLERGLLLWGSGDDSGAREAWERIPAGAPEAAAARLHGALAALFSFDRRRLDSRMVLESFGALAGVPGREGRLARAARAACLSAWSEAREELRAETGWVAALLRGWAEHQDPAGDRAAAVRAYDEAIASGPPLAWAYGQRASLHSGLGDAALAVADYDRALGLNPGYAVAALNRGLLREAAGDVDGALADFGRAIEHDPEPLLALRQRARLRSLRGEVEGALADLSTAERLAPGDPEILAARGFLRLESGDLARSRSDFDAAIAADPESSRALYGRATVRLLEADLPGAIEDLDRSLELDPSQVEAYVNRGIAHQQRGDLEAALGDYDRAVGRNPRHLKALTNRGNARALRGDLEGAFEDYTRALETDAGYASALAGRGDVRRATGDLEGARSDYAKALERIAPDSPLAAHVRERLAELGPVR
ncbi:MAG: tetratricopeptide repeat protein [Planctomycetales bacterium]|nr:tetratricopeptide repeat protein [Planctomycetales bacterium]